MIKIKLSKDNKGKIVFKLKIAEEDKKNILFKRAIMESKIIKGKARYDYEVPLRFFVPIFKNIDRQRFILDKKSVLSYLEFSDYYDENYYAEIQPTAKYMKKWREEGCPNIYRITIDQETYEIKKEIAFKKPRIYLDEFNL